MIKHPCARLPQGGQDEPGHRDQPGDGGQEEGPRHRRAGRTGPADALQVEGQDVGKHRGRPQ